MSRKSFRSKTIDLPGVAKVGNDAHRKELEASFKEENHSEDSIEVVKAVHEERLRFKPDEKRENNGLPKKSFLRNNKILPTNPLFLVSWQKRCSPNVLEGHHKGGEEDEGEHHGLKVLVLYQPAGISKGDFFLFFYTLK